MYSIALVPAIESADFDEGMLFVLKPIFRTATEYILAWQQLNGGHVQPEYLWTIALRSLKPYQAPSWIDMSEHLSSWSCESTSLGDTVLGFHGVLVTSLRPWYSKEQDSF